MGLAAPIAASAQQDYKARSWAASCAACHGTNGHSTNEIKPLAGKDKIALVKILKEFRAGERKVATVMHQHAKGYSDDQIERIAAYFAAQKK
ncbi:MAG: cytochrome C [Rhodocyclales bacterium CG_4_9_14_3_um_filter_68_10]|nr:MAG: cytochrome C [Rhodocyclales bacterium CG_4_10_14_3_um_filter_68_10]PJA57076.1 MAG: cytochrome C [Rhodocyclales bacterium CG_4_9_14_3_um_filter_68_10]